MNPFNTLRTGCLLVLGAATCDCVRAEPRDTPEKRLEWENALSLIRSATGSSNFLYQPKLSFKANPSVHLMVQPSWIWSRAPGGGGVQGLGDTNLDMKWSFHRQEPITLWLKSGVALPTAERNLGLPHGSLGSHAEIAALLASSRWTLRGRLRRFHNPAMPGSRTTLTTASAYAAYTLNEKFCLSAEAVVATNIDSTHHAPTNTFLGGLTYTPKPGLDLDLAWLHVGGGASRQAALYLGLVHRFQL